MVPNTNIRHVLTKRPPFNNENSSALDPRRQEKERETKNIMERDSGERHNDQYNEAGSGYAGVEEVCCCPTHYRV